MNLFEKLSIYGVSEIEDIILAGLVTGDPVLLVGRHGTGKTMLTRKIADSLGMNYIAYDASKALFDDVIGFPNPKSLSDGVLDYIPTPISIWDKEFLLIDEISRANTSMQNKWLEIIRSRQVMGKPITSLKYIFAAMNPVYSYSGANALDPALSGRFSFIVPVPEVNSMEHADIRKIISNISEDDAVALKKTGKQRPDGSASGISSFVAKCQQLYPEIEKQYSKFLSDYILQLSSNMMLHKVGIDGRRLGMILRNCIAYFTVQTAKYPDKLKNADLMEYVYNCIKYSLPDESTGEPMKEDTVMSIHLSSVSNEPEVDKHKLWLSILTASSCIELVELYIKNHAGFDSINFQEVSNMLSDKWGQAKTAAEIVDLYYAVRRIIKFIQEQPDLIEPSVVAGLMDLFSNMYFFMQGSIVDDSNSKEYKNNIIKFENQYNETAYRLTYNYQKKDPRNSRSGFNKDMFLKIKILIERHNKCKVGRGFF